MILTQTNMIGLHLLRKGAIRCHRDRHALDGRDRVIIWKKNRDIEEMK